MIHTQKTTTKTHSPLFEKIIQARKDAGFNEPAESTLTDEELKAVRMLDKAIPGTEIHIGNGPDSEIMVKG